MTYNKFICPDIEEGDLQIAETDEAPGTPSKGKGKGKKTVAPLKIKINKKKKRKKNSSVSYLWPKLNSSYFIL